jgi:hypothetical protein
MSFFGYCLPHFIFAAHGNGFAKSNRWQNHQFIAKLCQNLKFGTISHVSGSQTFEFYDLRIVGSCTCCVPLSSFSLFLSDIVYRMIKEKVMKLRYGGTLSPYKNGTLEFGDVKTIGVLKLFDIPLPKFLNAHHMV